MSDQQAQDAEAAASATLTDEDIETRALGTAPVAVGDDTSDTGDTGDDAGDAGDTSDTGDDAGDTSDTGDDAGSASASGA